MTKETAERFVRIELAKFAFESRQGNMTKARFHLKVVRRLQHQVISKHELAVWVSERRKAGV